MKKTTVLLDLDDTLYSFTNIEKIALERVYEHYCTRVGSLDYEQFSELYKRYKKEIQNELSGNASAHNRILYFQRLVEKTTRNFHPTFITELHDIYWKHIFQKMKLFDGAEKVLEDIKKMKLNTVMVSDHVTYIQIQKIRALGISKYIDYLVTSEEAGADKPNPYMFLLALHKAGAKPEEAVMVGDSPNRDIEGANMVDIDSILFNTRGFELKEENVLAQPKYVISDLSEVLQIVSR